MKQTGKNSYNDKMLSMEYEDVLLSFSLWQSKPFCDLSVVHRKTGEYVIKNSFYLLKNYLNYFFIPLADPSAKVNYSLWPLKISKYVTFSNLSMCAEQDLKTVAKPIGFEVVYVLKLH